MPRPTSITIIGWLETVFGALGLLATLGMAVRRGGPIMFPAPERIALPNQVHIVIAFAGAAIGLLCRIGLLNRQNWSRYLYVGWSLVNFAYTIVIFSLYMLFFLIPSAVVFLVIVYFLFTPVAKQYFTGNGTQEKV